MPVSHLREMPVEEADGKRIQYAAPAETGAATLAFLRGRFAAGSGNPPHRHDHEEIVFVLDGSGVYTIGPQTYEVRAGDVVVVPEGVIHAFHATEDAEAIGIISADARTFAPDGSVADE